MATLKVGINGFGRIGRQVLRAASLGNLDRVRRLHQRDLAEGHGRVVLPGALERKFPGAPAEWRWQFVFPATRICRDPRYGPPTRYHLHESVVQRAVTAAARAAAAPAAY